jgi:hypothetical protein
MQANCPPKGIGLAAEEGLVAQVAWVGLAARDAQAESAARVALAVPDEQAASAARVGLGAPEEQAESAARVGLAAREEQAESVAQAAPVELAAPAARVESVEPAQVERVELAALAQVERVALAAQVADPLFPRIDLRPLEPEPVVDQVPVNSLPHDRVGARRAHRRRQPGSQIRVHSKVAATHRRQASVALPAAHPAVAPPVQHLPVLHLPAVRAVAVAVRHAHVAVAVDVDRIGSSALFDFSLPIKE